MLGFGGVWRHDGGMALLIGALTNPPSKCCDRNSSSTIGDTPFDLGRLAPVNYDEPIGAREHSKMRLAVVADPLVPRDRGRSSTLMCCEVVTHPALQNIGALD